MPMMKYAEVYHLKYSLIIRVETGLVFMWLLAFLTSLGLTVFFPLNLILNLTVSESPGFIFFDFEIFLLNYFLQTQSGNFVFNKNTSWQKWSGRITLVKPKSIIFRFMGKNQQIFDQYNNNILRYLDQVWWKCW